MKSRKVLWLAVPVLALTSIVCSTGNLVPQGISETLQAFTQQVPALQTQVVEQLTQAAQVTGLPDAHAIETQVALQLTQISGQNPTQQGGTDNIPTNTPPGGLSGSISGSLSYPAEGIPPMAVVAYRVGGQPNEYYYIVTGQNQSSYQLDNLPEGSYYIVAYPLIEGSSLSGGYSQAVPCGLSVNCSDHSLIAVSVTGSQVTTGADPGDWYAPQGSFPANPLP